LARGCSCGKEAPRCIVTQSRLPECCSARFVTSLAVAVALIVILVSSRLLRREKGGILNITRRACCIDPYNTQESEGTDVETNPFDSLTVNPDRGVEPAAADSWSSDASATVWTFKPTPVPDSPTARRSGADFSTLNRLHKAEERDDLFDPYHLTRFGFADAQAGHPMPGVKAVDDTTLQVSLSIRLPTGPTSSRTRPWPLFRRSSSRAAWTTTARR
jgi:ABC-type oligopeptide transport system substrate-binding subunit